MKKNSALFFFLFVFHFFVAAQTQVYQKTFGGPNNEAAYSVISTSDKGYAMAGSTNSYGAGDFDVLLIKLDSSANIQWSKVYGGAGNDQALSLVQAADGGFAVCGRTTSYGEGNFDVLLIKTDSNGNQEWMKTFGGVAEERALNMRQTSDHGFILAGSTLSYGQGNWDMLFIKTDSTGDTLWTKIMGGPNYDQGTDADQTSDGGYIFSGRASSWGSGSNDIFLAKTNAGGDTLWTRVFGSPGWDEGMKVKQTIDGGYIVTGASTGFTNGGYDVYLNKIDSAGHLSWSKLYAGVNTDATYDVLQLHDGGYIVTGETESYGTNHHPRKANPHHRTIPSAVHLLGTDYSNVFVIRTDANGDTLWTHTYGGGLMDESNSIIQTPDHGFMIAAFSSSFSGDSTKFYLVKIDSTGITACDNETSSPVVSVPPTVEMNTTVQISSGLVVTNVVSGVPSTPVVAQNNICFAITGTNEQVDRKENVYAYPNPCHTEAMLILPSACKNNDRAEVFLYDICGRTVKQYFNEAQEKIQLPIKDFSPGVYLIRVLLTKAEKKSTATFISKLVVE